MVGADMLDAARYPTIRFASTAIVATGPDRWNVTGQLMVRGVTRLVTVPVVRVDGLYRGDTRIRQRDFGIKPVRLAGGAVSVRDEVTVTFEIAVAARADTNAAVH